MVKIKRGAKLGDIVGRRHPVAAAAMIILGALIGLSMLDFASGQEIFFKPYFEPFIASTQSAGANICGKFGATVDDYLLLLERPLWLQYVGDLYYHALYEEYNALAEDDESRIATFDEYFSVRLEKALEGSELVNVGG